MFVTWAPGFFTCSKNTMVADEDNKNLNVGCLMSWEVGFGGWGWGAYAVFLGVEVSELLDFLYWQQLSTGPRRLYIYIYASVLCRLDVSFGSLQSIGSDSDQGPAMQSLRKCEKPRHATLRLTSDRVARTSSGNSGSETGNYNWNPRNRTGA